MNTHDEHDQTAKPDDEHDKETVDIESGTREVHRATLLVNAPLVRLSAAIQRTMDVVGHTMRAIEEFRPMRDLALPDGVLAAFGVHTESHVPGAPIALQVAPSIPLETRGREATAWIIRKGLSDLITALSGYALQLDRVFAMVDVVRQPGATFQELYAAGATDSRAAVAFDKRPLPQKLAELRRMTALAVDHAHQDLETRVLSINRARNCFEHRAGWVGPQECAANTTEFVLEWVAPDLTDGRSSETITPGQYVETLHVNLRTKRRRTFARDTLISLTSREFLELCWTLNAYAETVQRGAISVLEADPVIALYTAATGRAHE